MIMWAFDSIAKPLAARRADWKNMMIEVSTETFQTVILGLL